MAKVKVLKSYMVGKKVKKSQFTTNVKSIKKYFDNCIKDAKYLAKTKK